MQDRQIQFLVYDSTDKATYSSGNEEGLAKYPSSTSYFMFTSKQKFFHHPFSMSLSLVELSATLSALLRQHPSKCSQGMKIQVLALRLEYS